MTTFYLAGGIFNAAERLHNLYLEKYLKELGHRVVLPQREALKFFRKGRFDIARINKDCVRSSVDRKKIYVGCADCPDADSGTAIEYGMTIVTTRRAIVYRTDIRTDAEKEIGVNAMFKTEGTIFIYHPCYFTELDQIETYYKALERKIHCASQKLR